MTEQLYVNGEPLLIIGDNSKFGRYLLNTIAMRSCNKKEIKTVKFIGEAVILTREDRTSVFSIAKIK